MEYIFQFYRTIGDDEVRNMKLYTRMEEMGIEMEEVEIRLCIYVFKNTKELMQFLKNNHYIASVINNGHHAENKLLGNEHLEFTYDDVDSLEYVTNCTEENAFSVGTIASAGFNFSIFEEKYSDDGDISYYDYDFAWAMVIPVFSFYYNDEQLDTLQLGVFHVDSYEKEDEMIKFTCLDNTGFLDKKIKKYITETIKLPGSMYNIIAEIITGACNMSMTVSGADAEITYPTVTDLSDVKNMTARTILSYMLELIGAFGCFSNTGAFQYKTFNKNNGQDIMIPIDRVMEYKRNGYSAIMNGARLNYGDDVGVGSFSWMQEYIPADIDGDGVDEETESPIPLTENNPVLKGKENQECQTILHNLLDRMRNFNFKPGQVTTFLPDFRIEPGDFVAVEDKLQYTRKFMASQVTYRDNLEMEIVSAWDGETYNIKNDGSVFIGKKSIVTAGFRSGNLSETLKRLTGVARDEPDYDTRAFICKNVKELTEDPLENGYPYIDITRDGENEIYAYLDTDTIIMFSEADVFEAGESFLYGFEDYIGLEKIDLSMIDTRKTKDMRQMFNNVRSAPGIVWGNYFDTGNVTDMSGMFQFFGRNVKDLTLDLSHFNTSNVHYMDYMFGHTGTDSDSVMLDISNFDVTTVLNMSGMFYATAANAESVTFKTGQFYTLNVTDMSYMFAECNMEIVEKVLNNPDFTTINVTDMSGMFSYIGKNSENVTLDLSKFDTSRVTKMNAMFLNTGLNSTNFVIKLGRNFDMTNVSDCYNMFQNHGIAKIICPVTVSTTLKGLYDGVIETYI